MLISLPHIDTHTHTHRPTHTLRRPLGEAETPPVRESVVPFTLRVTNTVIFHWIGWRMEVQRMDEIRIQVETWLLWSGKKKKMNSTVWHISIKRRKQTNSPVERWFWAPALEWNCLPVTPAWPLTRWAAWGQFLSEALFAHLIFNFFLNHLWLHWVFVAVCELL